MNLIWKLQPHLLFFYTLLDRHWTNCHWKLKQLREDTVWVLIQQACQRSKGCRHHQCILQVAVQMTSMQLLLNTQNLANHPTLGNYSHTCMLIQIQMGTDAVTCRASILRLICKLFECAIVHVDPVSFIKYKCIIFIFSPISLEF